MQLDKSIAIVGSRRVQQLPSGKFAEGFFPLPRLPGHGLGEGEGGEDRRGPFDSRPHTWEPSALRAMLRSAILERCIGNSYHYGSVTSVIEKYDKIAEIQAQWTVYCDQTQLTSRSCGTGAAGYAKRYWKWVEEVHPGVTKTEQQFLQGKAFVNLMKQRKIYDTFKNVMARCVDFLDPTMDQMQLINAHHAISTYITSKFGGRFDDELILNGVLLECLRFTFPTVQLKTYRKVPRLFNDSAASILTSLELFKVPMGGSLVLKKRKRKAKASATTAAKKAAAKPKGKAGKATGKGKRRRVGDVVEGVEAVLERQHATDVEAAAAVSDALQRQIVAINNDNNDDDDIDDKMWLDDLMAIIGDAVADFGEPPLSDEDVIGSTMFVASYALEFCFTKGVIYSGETFSNWSTLEASLKELIANCLAKAKGQQAISTPAARITVNASTGKASAAASLMVALEAAIASASSSAMSASTAGARQCFAHPDLDAVLAKVPVAHHTHMEEFFQVAKKPVLTHPAFTKICSALWACFGRFVHSGSTSVLFLGCLGVRTCGPQGDPKRNTCRTRWADLATGKLGGHHRR